MGKTVNNKQPRNPHSDVKNSAAPKAPSAGIQKKKQPSRKGKKAWRANIDIDDVEEALEEKRADERIGKISDLSNESLFLLDDAGDAEIQKKVKPTLRVDEIIAQRSKVKAVNSRATKESSPVGKKVRKFSKATLKQLANLAKKPTAPKQEPKPSDNGVLDLWDAPVEVSEPTGSDFVAFTKIAPVKAPRSMAVRPKKLPAVKVSHPGTSYNPTESDHKELISIAYTVEERKENERLKLAEAAAKQSNAVSYGPEDMVDTIPDEEVSLEENESEEKRKIPKRKTAATRRKAARHLETERQAKLRKAMKKTRAVLDSVKKLSNGLHEEKAAKDAEIAMRAKARQEENALPKKKLGKYKVPDTPIDVQLTEDLVDSLRRLKPEGNLFKDRFISLQERNLIEPRIPVGRRRRYAPKEYEKPAYKSWHVQQLNNGLGYSKFNKNQ